MLDIGGALMPETKEEDAFTKRYRRIRAGAREYRVVDYQQKPGVDDVVDLNRPGSVETLRGIIDGYRPEVILAMEVLEHVNYHYEVRIAPCMGHHVRWWPLARLSIFDLVFNFFREGHCGVS